MSLSAASKLDARPAQEGARCEIEQRLLGWQLSGAPGVMETVAKEIRCDVGSFLAPYNTVQSSILREYDGQRSISVRTIYALLEHDLGLTQIGGMEHLQTLAFACPAITTAEDGRKQAMEAIRAWRMLRSPLPRPGDVELTCAYAVTPARIDWIWPGWLAAGKFHLIAGDPGSGKTTIALSFGATITTGGQFPCGWRTGTGSVLMWTGEDDLADSIVPRFMACGGDLKRLHFVTGVKDENGRTVPFDPAYDVDRLIVRARSIPDLRLLIVDPIISAVNGDSHKAAETRRSLQPLVDFAVEARAAVLGITHYSKGTGGRKRAERVLGSGAFVALSRLTMATARPMELGGSCRLARIKTNIGADDGCFEYSLERLTVDAAQDIQGQRVLWGDALEGSGQALLDELEMPDAEDAPRRQAAEDWLAGKLRGGKVRATDIELAARDAGHSKRTLDRAKEKIGVKSVNAGREGWFWQIEKNAKSEQDCHSPSGGNVATLPECHINGLASLDSEVAIFPVEGVAQ